MSVYSPGSAGSASGLSSGAFAGMAKKSAAMSSGFTATSSMVMTCIGLGAPLVLLSME